MQSHGKLNLVAILLAANAASGCAADSHRAVARRFPIGTYGITQPEEIPVVAAAGFDSIQTYVEPVERLKGLAEAARRAKVRMVAPPDGLLRAGMPPPSDWPIEAWYVQDEPDVRKTPPDEFMKMDKRVADWDSSHLRTFVVGQGKAAKAYGAAADILMVDWYPIPHMPMETVGEQLDIARGFVGPQKPIWMVIQAYDWKDYWGERKKEKKLRFPYHSEMRYMSYLAFAHGARGLFFFSFSKKNKPLTQYPELWQAVSRVARELRDFQSTLASASEPKRNDAIQKPLYGYKFSSEGREFLMLFNPTPDPKPLPRTITNDNWRLLFEPYSLYQPQSHPNLPAQTINIPGRHVFIVQKR